MSQQIYYKKIITHTMDDIFYPLHSFKEQFSFEPEIYNKEQLTNKKNIIVCGMGGSAISVSLLNVLYKDAHVTLHNDYGLPVITDKDNTLLILNSYSGNTEEILDVMEEAKQATISMAAISCGGELIERARYMQIPYIVLPTIGIEPRFAIGHQLLALLALQDKNDAIQAIRKDVYACDVTTSEQNGKLLAQNLLGKYPILYASKNLFPVAYLIKAAINEGSKIPCFVNTISEANHNEIQGFISHETKKEATNFMFVMFTSKQDHPRILKRFTVMKELYEEEGFDIAQLETDHTNHTKMFELILTGYFAATELALLRGEDSYKTPFIQLFKKRII